MWALLQKKVSLAAKGAKFVRENERNAAFHKAKLYCVYQKSSRNQFQAVEKAYHYPKKDSLGRLLTFDSLRTTMVGAQHRFSFLQQSLKEGIIENLPCERLLSVKTL